MKTFPSERAAHAWLKVLAADVLAAPAGLVILIYLTRRLGPSGYGFFVLATTAVLWVEWSLAALFGRAAVKMMSETTDWQTGGTALLRLQTMFGVAVGAMLAVLASPMAGALGAPELTPLLRILSLDLPLFMWTQGYRNVVVGQGRYVTRASLSALRQIARVSLLILLVEMGFSIRGAAASLVCASAVEVMFGWWRTGISPFGKGHIDHAVLWRYALPTFLFAGSLRLFDKLDLFMLKSMGGSVALAGVYGAAQRLSYTPSILASSFGPLLLASLATLRRHGSEEDARSLGAHSLRLVLLLVPFAAILSSSAAPFVRLIFGSSYTDAGPITSILIFAGVAELVIAFGASILIAAGRPELTFAIAGPLVPLTIALQWFVIPSYGAIGAASVTTALAIAAAVVAVIVSSAATGASPGAPAILWTLIWTGIAVGASSLWPAHHWNVLVKLVVMSLLVSAGLIATGQLGRRELALLTSRRKEDTPDAERDNTETEEMF